MYNILDSGNLILLVPYARFLYGTLDKNLGHFRRYSREEIVKKLEKAGFSVGKVFYMNFLAMFGWFVAGKILRKEKIDTGDMGMYDTFFPLIKAFEKIARPFIGLSIVCIAKK